jgi:hypothetical protein
VTLSLPLHIVVQQLLLGRTDGLTAPQLAAFLSGWTSLLDLLKRPELCLPGASSQVQEALAELVELIEDAQRAVLGSDDDASSEL